MAVSQLRLYTTDLLTIIDDDGCCNTSSTKTMAPKQTMTPCPLEQPPPPLRQHPAISPTWQFKCYGAVRNSRHTVTPKVELPPLANLCPPGFPTNKTSPTPRGGQEPGPIVPPSRVMQIERSARGPLNLPGPSSADADGLGRGTEGSARCRQEQDGWTGL